MSDSYLTVLTCFVESEGERFAHLRGSNTSSGPYTALFAHYFRGGMDHLNSLLTDGLAESRKFILYNGRGVASSTHTAHNHIEDRADDIALVISMLGLLQVDLLARNTGGFPMQEVILCHQQRVRVLLPLRADPCGGDSTMERRGQRAGSCHRSWADGGRLPVSILRESEGRHAGKLGLLVVQTSTSRAGSIQSHCNSPSAYRLRLPVPPIMRSSLRLEAPRPQFFRRNGRKPFEFNQRRTSCLSNTHCVSSCP